MLCTFHRTYHPSCSHLRDVCSRGSTFQPIPTSFRFTRSLRHRSSCSARRRARGGAGEAGREAHASIPILPRHSTLSASSAVRPAAQASSRQQAFLFSLSRNATGLDQDDAAGLDAFDCYRRMRSPDAAIRAVRLSQHLEAEQHLLKRPSLPSSRLLCLPLTCNRLCQKAAPPPGLP